jgi:hypothetical protein
MILSPLDRGRYDVDQLRPAFALPEFRTMAQPATTAIAEAVRKSVLFVGIKENGVFKPKATAFIISVVEGGMGWRYLVTAEHVISGLLTKNHRIWIRSNRKDGPALEEDWGDAQWIYHPDAGSTDVAIAPMTMSEEEDYRSLVLNGPLSIVATIGVLTQFSVSEGHDVLITGLFRSHFGEQRNIPIVRTGNIALMVGEKVFTSYCGYTDAYLIEARSISGLSGSPVFIVVDVRENGIVVSQKVYLLGLMHGHFDVKNLAEDVVFDAGEGGGINTGIGVVIPVEKILETIFQPEMNEMRKEAIAHHRKQNGATPDLDVSSEVSPTKDENPQHREDFTSLLGKAARTPPQDG